MVKVGCSSRLPAAGRGGEARYGGNACHHALARGAFYSFSSVTRWARRAAPRLHSLTTSRPHDLVTTIIANRQRRYRRATSVLPSRRRVCRPGTPAASALGWLGAKHPPQQRAASLSLRPPITLSAYHHCQSSTIHHPSGHSSRRRCEPPHTTHRIIIPIARHPSLTCGFMSNLTRPLAPLPRSARRRAPVAAVAQPRSRRHSAPFDKTSGARMRPRVCSPQPTAHPAHTRR